jgi:hypothetical protein
VATYSGVFRTTNNGEVWEYANQFGIMAFGISRQGYIFAGRYNGEIYQSTNNGSSWTDISTGAPSVTVLSFAFDTNGFAYIGSEGMGLYRSTESITSVGDITNGSPMKYTLEHAYPNPFNPMTTIRYQLPIQSHVTLKIFDILGRDVATLVDDIEEPGYKSVRFNAQDLASGVYYYRIKAGNYCETKILLLIK